MTELQAAVARKPCSAMPSRAPNRSSSVALCRDDVSGISPPGRLCEWLMSSLEADPPEEQEEEEQGDEENRSESVAVGLSSPLTASSRSTGGHLAHNDLRGVAPPGLLCAWLMRPVKDAERRSCSRSPVPKRMPRAARAATQALRAQAEAEASRQARSLSPTPPSSPPSKPSQGLGAKPKVCARPSVSARFATPLMSTKASSCPSASARFATPLMCQVKADVPSPGLSSSSELRAIEVLARHAARLGPGGVGLEEALRHTQAAGVWSFLSRPEGLAAYCREKLRFSEIYQRSGRHPATDQEVLRSFVSEPSNDVLMPPTPAVSTGSRARPVQPTDSGAVGSLGEPLVSLPIAEVRFAHNAQSERFGKGGWEQGSHARSILQLTVELLAGATDPEAVPAFAVCQHEGLWYCRSGNRRLAALRLAQRYDPHRFRQVRVQAVQVDETFVNGTWGRIPKLTTHWNGEACEGRWLMIRETGEAVGWDEPGAPEYGADLLQLVQPSAKRRASGLRSLTAAAAGA